MAKILVKDLINDQVISIEITSGLMLVLESGHFETMDRLFTTLTTD